VSLGLAILSTLNAYIVPKVAMSSPSADEHCAHPHFSGLPPPVSSD
jgi:hypothetical protein